MSKPSQENVERARAFLNYRDHFFVRENDVDSLAAEFAASDAIARRRAIEECMSIVSEAHGQNDAFQQVAAILRAPTSEQTSEGGRTPASETLATHPPRGGSEERGTTSTAPTSEKAEETTAVCKACGGRRYHWVGGLRRDAVKTPCTACSPPADGGG